MKVRHSLPVDSAPPSLIKDQESEPCIRCGTMACVMAHPGGIDVSAYPIVCHNCFDWEADEDVYASGLPKSLVDKSHDKNDAWQLVLQLVQMEGNSDELLKLLKQEITSVDGIVITMRAMLDIIGVLISLLAEVQGRTFEEIIDVMAMSATTATMTMEKGLE